MPGIAQVQGMTVSETVLFLRVWMDVQGWGEGWDGVGGAGTDNK
jgi:hypothetical protein